MFYRLVYFIVLLIIGLFVTPIIFVPLALYYAMRWYALELILVGYVFDVYFGHVADWPYYTVTTAALVFGVEIAKRHLMIK